MGFCTNHNDTERGDRDAAEDITRTGGHHCACFTIAMKDCQTDEPQGRSLL